ncbi:MAG: hypothetical protein NTW91_09510 [Verrucomicrobia bacterium]|nr:hypothetical protein [Verrucomicrobiota bacterium]
MDKQQDTKDQGGGVERRKREAVRSDARIKEDAEWARAYLEGALPLELGEEVAHHHAVKLPEEDRPTTQFRFMQIAKSLAAVRPCFPSAPSDSLEERRQERWKVDQSKKLGGKELSFAGNGGVMPPAEQERNRALYYKEVAIRNGRLRDGGAPAAWRRLLHPKVGIFERVISRKPSTRKALQSGGKMLPGLDEQSRGQCLPDRLKMTHKGKSWLEKIARAEAMRWAGDCERMGMPVKSAWEHLAPGEEGEPRRLKPKILTNELVRDLAFEWLRDDRALVRFLQSLLASYDNLSRSLYSHKVTTAQAMSGGSLKTEDDDARLRMRIDALCGSGGGGSPQRLNKYKAEIRKSGRG